MCCFVTILMLLGPRAGVLIWWVIDPFRFCLAFNCFIMPVLGLLFLPWTTLTYLIVWRPATGILAWDWVWLAIALLADLGSLVGGVYGNRKRIPGYQQ
jgi:hypothetical protein